MQNLTIFLARVRLWVKVRGRAVIGPVVHYVGSRLHYSDYSHHQKKPECSLMTWWKHGRKSDGSRGWAAAIHDFRVESNRGGSAINQSIDQSIDNQGGFMAEIFRWGVQGPGKVKSVGIFILTSKKNPEWV